MEGRHFGGLGHGFLVEGAAALLVVLGEKVSLFGLLFALERGEGDFQGLGNLLGFDQGEPHAQQQGEVNQRSEKQGKTETISRAHAAMGEFGGQIGRECHDKKTNIARFTGGA